MEKIYIGLYNYASGPNAQLEQAACLDFSEGERFQKMRLPGAKAAFLAGRSLVRGMLAPALGCSSADIILDLQTDGKPVLQGHPEIHFNISHSHQLAVAAWGLTPLGIDIEHVRPNRDIMAIADGFYGPQEKAAMRAAGADATRIFHVCWTLKEAWLKLSGTGFAGYATVPQFLPGQDGNLQVIVDKNRKGGPMSIAKPYHFQVWELGSGEDHYFLALAYWGGPSSNNVQTIFAEEYSLPGLSIQKSCSALLAKDRLL